MKAPDWKRLLTEASSDVRRLSFVDRFSSVPVTVKENVAEHSFWVVLYSMMIHRELRGPEDALPYVLSYATVHDLPECLTGDVVRTFKYSTEEMRKAVDKAEDAMVRRLPDSLRDVYEEARSGAGKDALYGWYVKAVVKAADFMSLYQYMQREHLRGNSEIGQFVDRMLSDMRVMAKAMADLAEAGGPDEKAAYGGLAGLYERMSRPEGVTPEFTTT